MFHASFILDCVGWPRVMGDGGQGESLVPPYTRGSVSLSRGAGRKPGASLYTRKRLSLSRETRRSSYPCTVGAPRGQGPSNSRPRHPNPLPRPASRTRPPRQGLTLVHFSAQPEPLLLLKLRNIPLKVLTLS